MKSTSGAAWELFYFLCPVCDRRIAEPFRIGTPANSQPHVFNHHRKKGRRPCRVAIVPGPPGPHARPVPNGMTFEEFLRKLP